MKYLATQGARGGIRIRQISARDRARQRGAHDDLAALAGQHRRARGPEQLNIEPRHRTADGANYAIVIIGRDARALGHAIALPDLHPEALFEGKPDFARTTSAPSD